MTVSLNETNACIPVSGVILAGGRGSRMGGADKGWIDFHGKPLIEHVVACFAPQVNELLISANRNHDRYGALGFTVMADEIPDFAGPLAGILTAIHRSQFDLLAVVPCDCPRLPTDLVRRLVAALATASVRIAVAESGGRMHPTCMLCHRFEAAALQHYLESGGRRMQQWLSERPHVVVHFEDAMAFANLNDPDSLRDMHD